MVRLSRSLSGGASGLSRSSNRFGSEAALGERRLSVESGPEVVCQAFFPAAATIELRSGEMWRGAVQDWTSVSCVGRSVGRAFAYGSLIGGKALLHHGSGAWKIRRRSCAFSAGVGRYEILA